MTDRNAPARPILYDYFRSSAAYRARIALNLKGLDYEQRSVHLVRDGGEQHGEPYRAVNPQELVPTLVDGHAVVPQSLAIIEYLDETRPEPPLLPGDPADRARCRAMALAIACDIHPLNNLRVLQYLEHEMDQDVAARGRWYRHWVELGLNALEHQVDGPYCCGEAITMADVCLVPQLYNARRFDSDLTTCPKLVEIDARLADHPAFAKAIPANQPDAA